MVSKYLKVCCSIILFGLFPLMGSAKEIMDNNLKSYVSLNETTIDTLPKGKKTDGVEKDAKAKPNVEKEGGDMIKRPRIKEVPKARPKLRPGIITDKIKIKRRPIKVGKILRGSGLL